MSSSVSFLRLVSAGVVLALPSSPGNKIIGGETVDISSVPWQVALLENGRHVCGGTIISTRWILTAAHCTPQANATIISTRWILTAAHCTPQANATILGVRVASDKYASGGQYYEVEEVINREEYVNYTRHDIRLLKTKTDIVLSDKVAITTLPDQDEAPLAIGETLKVSGWGFIHINHWIKSDNLYTVDIKLLEFSKCEKEYPCYNLDENLQLCAASLDYGFCMGDSGGPVVDVPKVIGVVCQGSQMCGSKSEINTRVSGYRDWIKEKTGL